MLDTSFIVAALRSRNGASYALLSNVDDERLSVNLSTPLVKEYEDVLSREVRALADEATGAILDYLCLIGIGHKIYYLWRPVLKDVKDDMVLELAVKANAIIITFNKKDFEPAQKFNIPVMTPGKF